MVTTHAYEQIRADTARDELILGHLSLVRHIVGRIAARLPVATDLENLEAAGTLGLVEAANRYQPERGTHFKTFAYTRIRGAVYDELRRNCPLPQALLEKVALVRKAMQTMAPPVRVEDLAAGTGLSEDVVHECLAAIRLTRFVSWNDVAEMKYPSASGHHVPPEAQMESGERKALLVEAIEALPESERVAITLYYMKDLRLKEIGKVLDLSESRVSRLLKSAEHRIEEHIRARENAYTEY